MGTLTPESLIGRTPLGCGDVAAQTVVHNPATASPEHCKGTGVPACPCDALSKPSSRRLQATAEETMA